MSNIYMDTAGKGMSIEGIKLSIKSNTETLEYLQNQPTKDTARIKDVKELISAFKAELASRNGNGNGNTLPLVIGGSVILGLVLLFKG